MKRVSIENEISIESLDNGSIKVSFLKPPDRVNSYAIYKRLAPFIKKNNRPSLFMDFKNVKSIDDYGVVLLLELESMVKEKEGVFELMEAGFDVTKSLKEAKERISGVDCLKERVRPPNFLIRLGDATLSHAGNLRYMTAFLGSVIICFFKLLLKPSSLRVDDTISQMKKTGVDALPIIGLISFLLGLIMAFMSSLQLQQFGANIYVASLVAFAMVSELGPIMTAIVVAGRSGSAYAAEIGTMKISEEIDALFVMGFDPTMFLVIPRMLAAAIVVPLLMFFSDIFAIAGGLVIGVTMLDLSATSYLTQTLNTLTFFEFCWGTFKTIIFALAISWIGCLRGFEAKGGASAVGNAATSAVVSGIFLIILMDSIFAVIRSYL